MGRERKHFEGEFTPPAMGKAVAPINIAGTGRCSIGRDDLQVQGEMVRSLGPAALLVLGAYVCFAYWLGIEFDLGGWGEIAFGIGLFVLLTLGVSASKRRTRGKSVTLNIPWSSIKHIIEDNDNPGVVVIRVRKFKPSGEIFFTPAWGVASFLAAVEDKPGG
jgi:hypothetical protein